MKKYLVIEYSLHGNEMDVIKVCDTVNEARCIMSEAVYDTANGWEDVDLDYININEVDLDYVLVEYEGAKEGFLFQVLEIEV